MRRDTLVNAKLAASIAHTHLARDPGVQLWRTAQTYDVEGDYVGTQTLIGTFDASIGIPTAHDKEFAAQRGYVLDAILETVPQIFFSFQTGDTIVARGTKWTVKDVFTQIITKVTLVRFGVS